VVLALSLASSGVWATISFETFQPEISDSDDSLTAIVEHTRMDELLARQATLSPWEWLELGLGWEERAQSAHAAACYHRASAEGLGAADVRLARLCEVGDGVPQDYGEARKHYTRAIERGVTEAHLRLGMLWLEGWGGPQDSERAFAEVLEAAEANYAPAQRIVSDMYFLGVATKPDLGEALAWAKRAATTRDPEALTAVGSLHQAAVRLPQDLRLAREWYQLSAEQDYTRAMLAMASTFLHAGAKKQDLELGIEWLELAADGGNAAAYFYLAGMLLNSGLYRDDPTAEGRAKALLEQAAAGGESAADEVLQIASMGTSLDEAFTYVFRTPFEERYVRRVANLPQPENVVNPMPTKVVMPVFPESLRLTKVTGEVMVEFVVDTTGRVRDPFVVSASHPGFAEAALRAVNGWRFQPARKSGRVANARVRVPVQFVLSDVRDAGGPRSPTAVHTPDLPSQQ